jgi:hypothetical protein
LAGLGDSSVRFRGLLAVSLLEGREAAAELKEKHVNTIDKIVGAVGALSSIWRQRSGFAPR